MGCSVINVTWSAGSLEGVNAYADLVYKNVTHIQGHHMASEKVIQTTQGPAGSYWIGMLQLTVSNKDINTSLVQLDAVEDGYVEGAEEVIEMVFGDMRAEVVPINDGVDRSLLEMNQYLHNKVQELTRAIAIIEMQLPKLLEMAAEATATAKNAQTRIDGTQGYLFNYVDIPGLVKTVRTLAETVDEDILDDYTSVKVH